MSIKKLFESTDKSKNYLSDTNQKEAFEDIESSENLKQIKEKQEHYQPHVDYSAPTNFAKFGSAYLYYDAAFTRILDYYPYDGSDAEVNKFYNHSLDIEKYILDKRYPSTNGYVTLSVDSGSNGTGWGAREGSLTPDGSPGPGPYGLSRGREYILFYGGPGKGPTAGKTLAEKSPNPYNDKFQNANIYDTDIYKTDGLPNDYGKGTRQSNLRANFDDGVTVEFWLKTGSLNPTTTTNKSVIFDMWNNESSASADYGRLRIQLNNAATAVQSPFEVTILSGTTLGSINNQKGLTTRIGQGVLKTGIKGTGDWHHYALSFYNSGSNFVQKLYIDGVLNQELNRSGMNVGELKSKNMMGQIGALIAAPSGSATGGLSTKLWEHAGKLSGSIDEFRYWKVARNGKQIGRHWFTQVGGGANTDISNTTLGIYYKFNEGITNVATTDAVVLDYAGRVCNGSWTGYSAASRNVGSAIISASAAQKEHKDPIIRPNNPAVISLKKELLNKGQYHDYNNNSSFMNMLPGWMLDAEDTLSTSDLRKMTHIVGAYFDKLYLQIQEVPKLRQLSYPSSSYKPFPFAEHLPQSLGLYAPEIFIDASVLEKFANRDDKTLFENEINQTKNLIYQNLYNNLTNIFKSKGTEKAIRNVFRCFNIDDRILRLNINSNNNEFTIKNNLQQHLLYKNCLSLNDQYNREGVIYQRINSNNVESAGYISGSEAYGYEDPYGCTIETNVVFPFYMRNKDKFYRDYKNVSLFGMCTVDTGSAASKAGTETSFVTNDEANFQVLAVKDDINSKNAYFKLTSTYSPYPLPELTSSIFFNIYDNENWHFSVRLKPAEYPLVNVVTASAGYATGAPTLVSASSYTVIFQGINTLSTRAQNKFTLEGTMSGDAGRAFLRRAKRLYVGAERTNLTGTLRNYSDVLYTSTRYWAKYLEDQDLLQHALDIENTGISGSNRFISPIATGSAQNNADLLNSHTLALNWNFHNLTGSNAAGNLYVSDFSSGSAEDRANFGWLGQQFGYQLTGYGNHFRASNTDMSEKKGLNTYKFISPEQVVSSDMVQIFSEEDILYPNLRKEEIVPNFVYTIEKSLYNAVSEEMLDFLGGAIDFNDVIGAPVNRYRDRYKALEKLRESFFRRVSSVSDVEKYVEYYKWFDDSLTSIVGQLVPASAEFIDDVLNVVESHVLERNKYKTPFPTLDYYNKDVDTFMHGVMEKMYPWPGGGSPEPSSPRPTDERKVFWQERALRSSPEITSGDATIDSQRQKYMKTIFSEPKLSSSAPTVRLVDGTKYKLKYADLRRFSGLYQFNMKRESLIKGGVNFPPHKNIQYALTALKPAGPINSDNNIFVPQNVLLGLTDEMVKQQDITDLQRPKDLIKKEYKVFKVQHGRDWEEGMGYKNVKSTMAFPFNVMSSSVDSGFNKQVVDRVGPGIEITNLHNDVYGPDYDKPMQGPFTEYAVGGHQSRHIALNKGSDNWMTRPEAWKIVLGTCKINPEGAIGMVGPDYPYPEANNVGDRPYPVTGAQSAVYYRDMVAKRPVNIRNILMTTGSTILGNYTKNYQIVQSFGANENPRNFIEVQPTLPAVVFETPQRFATQTRTILDIHRTAENHFQFMPEFSLGYLTGATRNDSIITTRATMAPGIQTDSPGYRDFRGDEYSVYNTVNNRNLTVIKPSQGPSGTISEPTGVGTPGIRVYDIHGKDYGYRALLARHSARFGRDSLFVVGTSAATDGPGASYVQLPSFQKVHRNNLCRLKPRHDVKLYSTDSGYTNDGCVGYGSTNLNHTFLHTGSVGNTEVIKLAAAITGGYGYGLTWTGWVKFDGQMANLRESIAEFGLMTSNVPFCQIYKKYNSTSKLTEIGFELRTVDTMGIGNRSTATWVMSSSVDFSGSWNHLAITFESFPTLAAAAGAGLCTAHASGTIYLNGVSQSVGYVSTRPRFFTGTTTKNNFRSFVGKKVVGWEYMNYGGSLASVDPISASVDEYTFWTASLSASDISSIYNGGVPCDITASALYTASGSYLWDWTTFNDKDVVIDAANPGTYSNSNKVVGFKQQYIPMAILISPARNESVELTTPLAGCAPTWAREDIITYATSAMYDNFNVQHQIPRASRQYKWINNSIIDANNIRYCGFQNSFSAEYAPYYFSGSMTGEQHPYFNFVTESGVRSGYLNAYGAVTTNVTLGTTAQSTNRLNLLTTDPISGNVNTLGYPMDAAGLNYFNTDLNAPLLQQKFEANYLNALLTRRQATYGWTWKQMKLQDHPIIYDEKLNNVLSAITSSTLIPDHFRLPPLSLKGRTSIINFDAPSVSIAHDGPVTNLSLKSTETNDFIYFNELILNNTVNINLKNITTPLDMLIKTSKSPGFNQRWLLYSQNVFPSLRNEFHITKSCDNKFWRNSGAERVTVGNTFAESFNVVVSQSAWPLDPPEGFLTRTGPTSINAASPNELRDNGSAGELQNTYFHAMFGSSVATDTLANRRRRMQNLVPSGLYSRKHMLSAPTSVSPPGVQIAEVEVQASSSWPWATGSQISIGGGEALWEVGSQAGILTRTANGTTFEPSASNPWWNSYTDFNSDLKRVFKGYQIIPEFRISEHIEDYHKYGIADKGKTDWLEIVDAESTTNSSQKSFYKDYSNSDFLQGLLKINADTILSAKEIRIVCSASIRYNPYKGFYPAQRTLDLVSQFSRSFASGFETGFADSTLYGAETISEGGTLRPLMQPLVAPGILYNSIKAGMAVDYPIVTDPTKISKRYYGPQIGSHGKVGAPGTGAYPLTDNWALTIAASASIGKQVSAQYGKLATGFYGGAFWDQRLPFETIIDPGKYLQGVPFIDMEPHPSASFWSPYDVSTPLGTLSASWNGEGDRIYSMMASNFFGEVGAFFLKDDNFSRLEGKPVPNNMTFASGTIFGSRIKLRKSHNGQRFYNYESGATGNGTGYSKIGGAYFDKSGDKVYPGAAYPLPQDPFQNPNFRAFSMYSRPSAFGPACSGRSAHTSSEYVAGAGIFYWQVDTKNSVGSPLRAVSGGIPYNPDSFNGHNWAFTPPYYDGEAWCDVIFRPTPGTTYDLQKILAEASFIYRRADAGPLVTDSKSRSTPVPLLISESMPAGEFGPNIYDGRRVDYNAMQLSASINLLGIERIPVTERSSNGKIGTQKNEIAAMKWVISPKFETPIYDFNTGVRRITAASGRLTLPVYASESVPRGMWHQFAAIDPDPKNGIFLEIEDIPSNWLKYHHEVRFTSSPYNNFQPYDAQRSGRVMKSFADLMGVNSHNRSTKLGQIAEKRTIREAVVAIPYVIEELVRKSDLQGCDEVVTKRKKFIDIPERRFKQSLKQMLTEDETGEASPDNSESVTRLLRKMQRYVLPPQLDFLNNRKVKPIVMYMFEFEFELDKDDLSYIWQNTAPRDYKKFSRQSQSVAHELFDTELLNAGNLLKNQNLRWMVFKVKQRSQTDYYDLIPEQADAATRQIFGGQEPPQQFPLNYNWPYDYISFVELIRLDVDVLFKSKEATETTHKAKSKKAQDYQKRQQ